MKRLITVCLALPLVTPALALYKVVGPDGSITYTDRQPASTEARVSTIGATGAAGAVSTTDTAGLPVELREAVARYPVTFYAAPNCKPCDDARRMLQQRGVPFMEKRVETEDDVIAFERLTGSRVAPAATIGTQVLRGWSSLDWNAFLDAAAYPRESRLPAGWTSTAATPLASRAPAVEAPAVAASPAPSRARAPRPAPVEPPPGGFRF